MLKFIRGKGQQPSAERQKLQKELFAFRKTVQHGFPNKPTCLAWDPILRLMAIGTHSGAVKILGKPGVEFYGQHSANDVSISKLIFIPNQGRIISLCDDNSIHLWEIHSISLEEIKSLDSLNGKLQKVSVFCLDGSLENLLLGTEGGNIYLVKLSNFTMEETVIYQDVVMQNVPEDYKVNPGAVESIVVQPENPDNILIGYSRGLMVLWNMKTSSAIMTQTSTQGVESLCWKNSQTFVSSHNDGSYAFWSINGEQKEPNTVYGPFPCKPITKIVATDDEMIVFSGGMQRAAYSDRHTISVLNEEKDIHVVFDFTSKVIDFFIAPSGENTILIVLAEEELVALQLDEENTPMLRLPYLVSLHASVVTCSSYVSDISQSLWEDIITAGMKQNHGTYSEAAWPIDGGRILESESEPKRRDLLITGHEDGSVCIWDAASVAMLPFYKFSSSRLLYGDDEFDNIPKDESNDDDEWPPFKKVGSFDPYSDDPRLAVKKTWLCPETGTLVIAGTAGHVIVSKLTADPEPDEIKTSTMNIVSSRDEFVWKGHQSLNVRNSPTPPLNKGGGFAVSSVLQLYPPAAVTALAVHSGWGLIATGTAHGVAVYDYVRSTPVIVKCTLNPLDMSGAGEGPISRRKSFKKSLRESFRRLRKGRSQRTGTDKKETKTTPSTSSPSPTTPSSQSTDVETKPIERAIEARPVDDALGSMVRCLTFARTYIVSMQTQTPTLWVGTNNGTVYIFTVAIPGGAKRKEENVICQLGKEIQLKHRAPVVGISLIDGHCSAVDSNRLGDRLPPHRVLICSEEQIKVFTVPQLKPCCKLKLTAVEGARVRRTLLALFVASSSHSETCLLCLTNLGDVIVLSLPDLKRQLNAAVIRKEDINGISSLCFTERGEALYLHSSSELQRISVSASRITAARCKIDLPPGIRAEDKDESDASSVSSSSSESSSSSSSSADSQKESKSKKAEILENGVTEASSTNDLTCVGDITIDSVKDHLAKSVLTNNSLNFAEDKTEVVKNETIKVESSITTKTATTTVISTSESVTQIINNSVPTETESEEEEDEHLDVVNQRKAPLAKMEDIDPETSATK